MKYPCLVLDHDDTVVKSTLQIHYPAYLYTLNLRRPNAKILSQVEFQEACSHPGLADMYRENYGFTDEELLLELEDWKAFLQDKIPDPYEGFGELLDAYRKAGGTVCVVSHSHRSWIERDYVHHFGFVPDYIYDLTYPQSKPSPAPLLDIMEKTGFTARQLLVVDDLVPGKTMALTAGVDFAYAGWCNNPPSIHSQMIKNCHCMLKNVGELRTLLEV
jgi:phosphoglycolate phosphatase/pyrophosphatase PpaX